MWPFVDCADPCAEECFQLAALHTHLPASTPSTSPHYRVTWEGIFTPVSSQSRKNPVPFLCCVFFLFLRLVVVRQRNDFDLMFLPPPTLQVCLWRPLVPESVVYLKATLHVLQTASRVWTPSLSTLRNLFRTSNFQLCQCDTRIIVLYSALQRCLPRNVTPTPLSAFEFWLLHHASSIHRPHTSCTSHHSRQERIKKKTECLALCKKLLRIYYPY